MLIRQLKHMTFNWKFDEHFENKKPNCNQNVDEHVENTCNSHFYEHDETKHVIIISMKIKQKQNVIRILMTLLKTNCNYNVDEHFEPKQTNVIIMLMNMLKTKKCN